MTKVPSPAIRRFARTPRLVSGPAVALAVAIAAGLVPADAIEVVPHVGVDFDHFGEKYRLTEDDEVETTINDFGTYAGITLSTPYDPDLSFRLEGNGHLGQQSRRLELDLESRWQRGAHRFELESAGSWRQFTEDGDYAISGDYLQESARVSWERRLGEGVRVRLREYFDLVWYAEEDTLGYNLTSIRNRPAVDVRFSLGELSELRLGGQVGRRDVPDSTSLGYRQGIAEADLSLLFGWTSALDLSERIERRVYPDDSVRESTWEHRADIAFEFAAGSHATFRLRNENEIVRHDDPDDLDYDFGWARTGFQTEIHRTEEVDLSIMPVYAFLTSGTAPEEEYGEVGLEFGIDWRIGDHTWINLTDEIGRRDYEIDAVETSLDDLTLDDLASGDLLAGDDLLGATRSDYLYNRLTLLLTSELTPGILVNLFVNWQPENHRVSSHDLETRLVSGGVEYRF